MRFVVIVTYLVALLTFSQQEHEAESLNKSILLANINLYGLDITI